MQPLPEHMLSIGLKTIGAAVFGFVMGGMFFLYEANGSDILATLMVQGLATCF